MLSVAPACANGYLATAGEIDDLNDALSRFPELMPTFDNDDDYRHTFYAANQAIHYLDHTIGIPYPAQGREAPGLSL